MTQYPKLKFKVTTCDTSGIESPFPSEYMRLAITELKEAGEPLTFTNIISYATFIALCRDVV